MANIKNKKRNKRIEKMQEINILLPKELLFQNKIMHWHRYSDTDTTETEEDIRMLLLGCYYFESACKFPKVNYICCLSYGHWD